MILFQRASNESQMLLSVRDPLPRAHPPREPPSKAHCELARRGLGREQAVGTAAQDSAGRRRAIARAARREASRPTLLYYRGNKD